MPTSAQLAQALAGVTNHASLLQSLLAETLQWPIEDHVQRVQDIAYGWSAAELHADGLEAHLLQGQVWQIQPFRADQPWGIFVVEFAHDKVYRTQLRQVLRGLVPRRRHDPNLQAWRHENLLFICTTRAYERFTFAHFRGDKAETAKLATFGWYKGDSHLRTVCEFNLPALAWPKDEGADGVAWLKAWTKAFDKEPLTKDFFKRFDKAIDAVQTDLQTHHKLGSAEAYTKAQLLLERLVFLYFVQNRGWLNQQRDFLPANFAPYRQRPNEFSFYGEFLEKLFWTLASAPGHQWRMDGIPFLNGGLFDDDEFAPTPIRHKQNPPLKVTNETFALVAFNFTVREDTPLDQDVAVDPEMLGKVFESIVLHAEAADPDAVAPDKRKATGSYYTPRIVVHFICREVLFQYLRRHLPGDNWDKRLRPILEMDAANGLGAERLKQLRTLLTPEEGAVVRDQIRDLKCCDPAVGSGAFPVGLLHELVNLRRIAEAAANGYVDPVRKDGNAWLHQVKEQIVQDCLFGVDIQQQAIEICRLRLWLSLVVDYDLGIDAITAQRNQFKEAIARISQLPNLEMNFHRGDSLLDLISGVPVRIEAGALTFRKPLIDEIRKLADKLHRATKAERKRELRVEILRKRLELTEQVLKDELEKVRNQDADLAAAWFGELPSESERRNRLAHEKDRLEQALAKLNADRNELDKLAKRTFDSSFYPKLRRLEGADFNSPFNFAWRLDFAAMFSRQRPGFDIVVGNPPFVTARNPAKRELYRERWSRVCHLKFLLVCPFFELSFDLLRPNGELGFIVSNAFAKREFGRPLVEEFFPTVNVQKVVDCSGLLFPGHGTPTYILVGAKQPPLDSLPIRVATILPGGGDLRTPPEESPLWQTLAEEHDNPGFSGSQVVVSDIARKQMAKHPWALDSTTSVTTTAVEVGDRTPLIELLADEIGVCTMTNADDIFFVTDDFARRNNLPPARVPLYHQGEELKNWEADSPYRLLLPYDADCKPTQERKLEPAVRDFLRPYKVLLENRHTFGNQTFKDAGRVWYEFERMNGNKYATPRFIIFAHIATHNHFAYVADPRVFGRHAQVIKLGAKATDNDHHLLTGFLNSSTGLFWFKQNCFNKGAGEDEQRDRFEYSGTKVQLLPTPTGIADALAGKSTVLSEGLTALSRTCWRHGRELPALQFRKLLEKSGEAYYVWNASLPGHVSPHLEIVKPFINAHDLGAHIKRVINLRESRRAEMIARQEEIDWLVYAAYGLIGESAIALTDADLSLAREQRPFCLWAAAEGDFAKAVGLIPQEWSDARKELWRQRLEIIRDNEHVRRIEQPVYKRRWDEQYKIGNRWECGQPAYDAEFLDAFDWWLSEKAEWWLEHKHHGKPVDLDAWSDALWADSRVQAAWPVAAETRHRLELWKRTQSDKPKGRPPELDASRAAFAKAFKTLVKAQSVPENIPYAVPWDELEKKMKVPAAVKSLRGKLNVPRERFRVTADGLYRVASL